MNMTCAEIEERIGAYLADQLTVQERYRVEMHLDACSSCQAEIDSVSDIATLLKSSLNDDEEVFELDRTRRETLSRMFAEANPDRAARARWRVMRRATMGLGFAATLLIGAYLGFVSGNQRVQTPEFELQIASLPSTSVPAVVEAASVDEPTYGVSPTGSPYGELRIFAELRLPEYGSGPVVRAMTMGGTKRPYIGLPVPRPEYDFAKSSLVHE